jgi:tRNA threonylcarbamoyladenosine biosynthesis protein TsaE
MGRERVKKLYTAEDTQLFGYEFSRELHANSILALQGDLGAGKTTFVQGFAKGLGISDLVQSPTFTYLQAYEGSPSLIHFDLYRLQQQNDFLLLGFEEYFDAGGIVIIEWPERIASLIPPTAQLITLSHDTEGRTAHIQNWGQRRQP